MPIYIHYSIDHRDSFTCQVAFTSHYMLPQCHLVRKPEANLQSGGVRNKLSGGGRSRYKTSLSDNEDTSQEVQLLHSQPHFTYQNKKPEVKGKSSQKLSLSQFFTITMLHSCVHWILQLKLFKVRLILTACNTAGWFNLQHSDHHMCALFPVLSMRFTGNPRGFSSCLIILRRRRICWINGGTLNPSVFNKYSQSRQAKLGETYWIH